MVVSSRVQRNTTEPKEYESSKILNVHGVSEVRQAEIHIVEPQVPEPSALEV